MTTGLPLEVRSFEELISRFDYDATRALQIRELGVVRRDGALIQDLRYESLSGGQIEAYWVTPEGGQSYPVVIYLHPAPGSRGTYLEEAAALAGQGAASLLIEAPWAQMESFGPVVADPHRALETFTLFVKDLRRGIDLAAGRPGVDASRIGLVGHSLGAYMGGILAGVEKRLRAVVLISVTGRLGDVAAVNMPDLEPQVMDHYRQVIAPVDPVYYVGHAAPTTLFYQFGTQDDFYPHESFTAIASAGSQPKRVEWYETNHWFEHHGARQDRMAWLAEQLKAGRLHD